jgi:accessory gene regulator B
MAYLPHSRKAARFLASKANASAETEEVMAYAIEVLSLNLLNVILSLLCAYLLGLVVETIAALLVVSTVRFFSGGAHSNSPLRCTVVTVLLFPAIAATAAMFSYFGPTIVNTLTIVSVITGVTLVYYLAPVDSPGAPIISLQRRKKLRLGAMVTLMLWAIVLILPNGLLPLGVRGSISLAILWSAFILTRSGHNLFRWIDMLGVAKYEREEVV